MDNRYRVVGHNPVVVPLIISDGISGSTAGDKTIHLQIRHPTLHQPELPYVGKPAQAANFQNPGAISRTRGYKDFFAQLR